jgi:protein required for attachment to host cells
VFKGENMVKNWVLVACQSKAKIFEISKNNHHLKLIKKMENPKAAMKNGDLECDRPGVARGPNGRTALRSKKGAKDHEMEVFSKQVLDEINKGRNNSQFEKIIMIVDPGFLAHLENHLKDPVKKTIFQTIPKNYINTPDKKVEDLLKDILKDSFFAAAA